MTDEVGRLEAGLREKIRFLHFMIRAGNDKVGGEIPLKALEIKDRFMRGCRK